MPIESHWNLWSGTAEKKPKRYRKPVILYDLQLTSLILTHSGTIQPNNLLEYI